MFTAFMNSTDISSGRAIAEGALQWPPLIPLAGTARDGPQSSFAVFPALLEASEVDAALRIVRDGNLPLDTTEDTVDSMATFEMYWLSPPNKPKHAAQAPFRERLASLLRPIVDERVTPLVDARYRAQCASGCTPCTSLIRRYRPHERRSHAEHFDLQALVTVVISLSTPGVDFPAGSGLYVSTGAEVKVLGLTAGDALIHQSTLLHGVALADDDDSDDASDEDGEEDAGSVRQWERWSWIMWYSDSASCAERAHLWHQAAADAAADPLTTFLHAKRLHLDPTAPPMQAARARARYLTHAATGGFTRAMVDLGMAYKEADGVPRDLTRAARWWRRACNTADRAMACFNLGQLILESADEIADEISEEEQRDPVRAAVNLFFAAVADNATDAASPGRSLAYHNLGVAHLKGRAVPQDDDLAARYFGRAGTPTAMRTAAEIHQRRGRVRAAMRWMRRAANAGDAHARRVYPIMASQLHEWDMSQKSERAARDEL